MARRRERPAVRRARCSLHTASACDRALDQAHEHPGSLDLLHLGAGLPRPGLSVESTDGATFDALFDIHVKGDFFALPKALPLLPLVRPRPRGTAVQPLALRTIMVG